MALALRARSLRFLHAASVAGTGAGDGSACFGRVLPDKKTGAAAAATGALFAAVAIYSAWKSEPAHLEAEKIALDPNEWRKFKLLETRPVSHNTKVYRFKIDEDSKLGLLLVRRRMENQIYTPISDPEEEGHFDLLVKTYPQGKMSRHFASLHPGDTLEMKGPLPKLPYYRNMKSRIGMIAGGTGITPMFQVINEVLKNPKDNTQISLIYANLSPDDILLKDKLDELAQNHPNFQVFYIVDKPTRQWKGGSGYITEDVLVKGLPPPSDDSLILVCGPPGLMNHISGDKSPDKTQGKLTGLLKSLGYNEDQVYKF